MMKIRNLTDLEELVGIEKTNAIITEAFMTMVEKARRFDEIKNAVAVLQKSMKKVKPENMTLDEEHAIRTAKDNLEMLF